MLFTNVFRKKRCPVTTNKVYMSTTIVKVSTRIVNASVKSITINLVS